MRMEELEDLDDESREKCCFCFKPCHYSSNSQKCAKETVHDIYKSCLKFINHDYINSEEFLKWIQPKPLPFCQECLKWTLKLSKLNRQFENIERKIENLVFSFTTLFLKLRECQNPETDRNSEKSVIAKSTPNSNNSPLALSFEPELLQITENEIKQEVVELQIKQEIDEKDHEIEDTFAEFCSECDENSNANSGEERKALLEQHKSSKVKNKRKKSGRDHERSPSKELFPNNQTSTLMVKLTRITFDSEGKPIPDRISRLKLKSPEKAEETSPITDQSRKRINHDTSGSESNMSFSDTNVVDDNKTTINRKANRKSDRRVDKYKCELCTQSYQKKKHLRSHEKTHDVSDRFKCTICDKKSFTNSRRLRKHLLKHNNNLNSDENEILIAPTPEKETDVFTIGNYENQRNETPEIEDMQDDNFDYFTENENTQVSPECTTENQNLPTDEDDINPVLEEKNETLPTKTNKKSSQIDKSSNSKQSTKTLKKDRNSRKRKPDPNEIPFPVFLPLRKAAIKAVQTMSSLANYLTRQSSSDTSDSEIPISSPRRISSSTRISSPTRISLPKPISLPTPISSSRQISSPISISSDESQTASADESKTNDSSPKADRKYQSGQNERYQCQKCNKSYKKKQYLRDHEKTHDENNRFQCKICDNVSFAYIRSLRYHLIKHKRNLIRQNDEKNKPKGRFECTLCRVTYASLRNLRQHLLETHQIRLENQDPHVMITYPTGIPEPEVKKTVSEIENEENKSKNFDCKICDKFFGTYAQLYYHTTIAHKAKPSPCDICQMEFENSDKLKRHKRKVHSHAAKHKCEICNKEFKYSSSLKQHTARHTQDATDEKSAEIFQCNICEKVLATRGNLNYHMLGHSQVQPFECPQKCGKRFSSKRNMKRHAFIHRGERPFLCEECGQSFFNTGKLTAHKRIHTGKLHYCEVCGKGFQTTTHLKQHHRSHMTNKMKNKKSTETEPVKEQTKEIPAIVKYICAICLQAFDAKELLVKHMEIHNENGSVN